MKCIMWGIHTSNVDIWANDLRNPQTSFRVYKKLSFNCVSCSLCCRWFCYSYGAEIDKLEQDRIRKIIFDSSKLLYNLSPVELQSQIQTHGHLPVRVTNRVEHVISCLFLSEQNGIVDETNRGNCKIYKNRPFDCRIYPLFWDVHSNGKIMFHIEHCEGVAFDEKNPIEGNNITTFLEQFFETIDFRILKSKLESTPKKPEKILLFKGLSPVNWKIRNKIWRKLINKIPNRSTYANELFMRIYEEYQAIRDNFDRKDTLVLSNISIYRRNRKGDTCIHRITSEQYRCAKSNLDDIFIDAQAVRYLTHFMEETMLRERCYAINVKKYNLTMDDELQMFLSQVKDIFLFFSFLQTHRDKHSMSFYSTIKNHHVSSNLETYRIGLSRVDPYPDFYLFQMNKLKLMHVC